MEQLKVILTHIKWLTCTNYLPSGFFSLLCVEKE